jgi:putative transposase
MLCLKENENYEKKQEFRYRERNREERIKYYQTLRDLIKSHGSKSLVFIDKSGL